MRNKNLATILIFFLLLLVSACAPGQGPFRDILRPETSGPALFEKAESKYQKGYYPEARKLYLQYIEEFPDTDLADKARLKLARIKMHEGDFNGARQAFDDIIKTRQKTSAAADARLAILESYTLQGRFQEAIQYRRQMPEDLLKDRHLAKADLLAGDSAMALKEFTLAYEFFLSSFQRTDKGKQQEQAGQRLLASAFFMTPGQIEDEIRRLDGEPPSGYLMYYQGFQLMADGRFGDGVSVFQQFINQYPDHPMVSDAQREMERFAAEAFFEGRTIGVVLPLSGKYKAFGQRALQGIELAVYQADIRWGKDNQPPFKLLVRDSESDPQSAGKAVEDLAGKQVAAIIGPMIGDIEPLEAAQSLGVPIIALSQRSGVTETGPFVFRNFLTPAMQVSALVEHAVINLGCRRFAVLFPEESYGETFLHLFWDEVIAKGGWIAGAESYNPEHTDFSEPIKRLVGLYYELPDDLKTQIPTREQTESLVRALMFSDGLFFEKKLPDLPRFVPGGAGLKIPWADAVYQEPADDEDEPEPVVDFDAVFIPDSPEKAGLIIPQLRYYDINNVYLLGTNLWHSPRMLKIAGRQIRKAVIAEGFFADSKRPMVADFVSDFSDVYGQKPGFIEAAGYDSAMLVCRQLAENNIKSRPALRQALVEMPVFEGVTGATRFLPTGEAKKDIYLLDVVSGRFTEILP